MSISNLPIRYLRGLYAPIRAFFFILRRPGLLPYVAAPLVLNMVLYGVLLGVGFYIFAVYSRGLIPSIQAPWYAQVLGWSGYFAAWAAWLVISILAAAFTFSSVGCVVASPFNEALSAEVERMVLKESADAGGNRRKSGMLRDMWTMLKMEALRMSALLLLILLTSPLALLPFIGFGALAIVYSVTIALYMAMDFMDYPLSRKGMELHERLQFFREHFPETAGFASALYVLFLVPLLGFLCMPMAVTAGTLLSVDGLGGSYGAHASESSMKSIS